MKLACRVSALDGARVTDSCLADVWKLYRSNSACIADLDSWVHVWRICLTGLQEPVGENLSSEEIERAGRLMRLDDRRRFAATRSILRRILADVLGPGDDPSGSMLRVGYGLAGKPFLPREPQLHFNVSHSDGVALIAVTRAGAVGIDVERQRQMSDREAIANLVFDEAERIALRDCPTEERDGAFFRIWTRKEALLKAMGVGLPALTDPNAPSLAQSGTAWLVTSLPNLEGYGAALARPLEARGLHLWSWPTAAALRCAATDAA